MCTFYCQIMNREPIEDNVWSLYWHLSVTVRNYESNEANSGTGPVVSRIQIRFLKMSTRDFEIWLCFGLIKQSLNDFVDVTPPYVSAQHDLQNQ